MELNEENPKKVPRARKANFSMLEESILQREVENNFDVLRDKHSNSDKSGEGQNMEKCYK